MTFTKAFRTKAYEPHSKSVFHACKSSRAQHEFYTAEHRCFTQILNILFPSLLIQKLFLVGTVYYAPELVLPRESLMCRPDERLLLHL